MSRIGPELHCRNFHNYLPKLYLARSERTRSRLTRSITGDKPPLKRLHHLDRLSPPVTHSSPGRSAIPQTHTETAGPRLRDRSDSQIEKRASTRGARGDRTLSLPGGVVLFVSVALRSALLPYFSDVIPYLPFIVHHHDAHSAFDQLLDRGSLSRGAVSRCP